MKKFFSCRFCAAALLLFFSVQLAAAECTVSSGPRRVALLELYTSEGCSSCPPADRWLSGLSVHGFSTERVIPLALHVDYWDYIGWRDVFANPIFSARQRELAKIARARVVYTPQFVLNGRDFRAWRDHAELSRAAEEIGRKPAGADIKLSLTSLSQDRLEIAVTATSKVTAPAALYIALYQNGLASDVRAGENRGEKLKHDYVVREWRGPIVMSSATPTAWRQVIARKLEWTAANVGVAVFAQDIRNGEILQALQSPLCAP